MHSTGSPAGKVNLIPQPCPQGLLGIFQNGGLFEKYPEGLARPQCQPTVGPVVQSPISARDLGSIRSSSIWPVEGKVELKVQFYCRIHVVFAVSLYFPVTTSNPE